jgi:hypothetical protein
MENEILYYIIASVIWMLVVLNPRDLSATEWAASALVGVCWPISVPVVFLRKLLKAN